MDELLRLPFPLPEVLPDPQRASRIIKEVADIVTKAVAASDDPFIDRKVLVEEAGDSIEILMGEYFDILSFERALIDDTVRIIIPSARPTRNRRLVPTIGPSDEALRDAYMKRLCSTLNEWAKNSLFVVEGCAIASAGIGIGITMLEKNIRGRSTHAQLDGDGNVLATLDTLHRLSSQQLNTFELVRGIKVFEQDRLYIVKPIGQRFWTETAALNDADEIAGSILMQDSKEMA